MRLSIFIQEPLQLINNVKELLALQTDAHNRQPFQAQGSLNKSLNDQLAGKTSSNNLSLVKYQTEKTAPCCNPVSPQTHSPSQMFCGGGDHSGPAVRAHFFGEL